MDDRDDSPERGEWNPDPDEATGRRFFNEVEGWEDVGRLAGSFYLESGC